MKVCPNCQTKYPDDANFCPQETCATPEGPRRLDLISAAPGARYEMQGQVGGSRSGEVFRARDAQTGATVMYKRVTRAVLTSPTHPDQEAWSTEPKAQFKLTPPDDLSGVVGFYYLFSEDPQAVPDPKSGTGSTSLTTCFTDKNEITLNIPQDGVHTLAVICQDKAGNISKEVATYRVRLDTQVGQAVVQSSTHPDPKKWYPVQRVELTWKDPADLSGIEGYYYHLDREEQWVRDIQAMTWTTGRGTVVTIPEDGTWFLHVCAKDKAGNIVEPARYPLRIDSAAGVVTLKSSTHPPHQ